MLFNYKKHAKIIFSYSIFLPVTLCVLWAILVTLLHYFHPLYTPAFYTGTEIEILRDYKFEHRDRKKNTIHIYAGSNTLFGISTLILAKKTGYNVINYGSSLLYPISTINLIKQYAKPGDIVLAPLEYTYMLYTDALTDWVYNQFSTWAVKDQWTLPPKMQKDVLLRNIVDYWERLPYLYTPFPIKDKNTLIQHVITDNTNYPFSAGAIPYTQDGDLFCDSPPLEIAEFNPFTSENATPYFMEEMIKFNKYAQENGLKFYVTYPAMIKNSFFDLTTQETKKHLERYRQVFRDLDINFIGTEQFYDMDRKYFYDAPYHLNATGSTLRTLLLLEDINTYIFGKEPSYTNGSNGTKDNTMKFFQQKEKEAEKYIQKLREEDKKLKELTRLKDQELKKLKDQKIKDKN